MVERQEVDALLDAVKGSEHYAPLVRPQTLAALCRAWLAVQDGEPGWVCGGDLSVGTKSVKLDQLPVLIDVGKCQRVRIVKEVGDD